MTRDQLNGLRDIARAQLDRATKPEPEKLYAEFLDHIAHCPMTERWCARCEELLKAWGEADAVRENEQAEMDAMADELQDCV